MASRLRPHTVSVVVAFVALGLLLSRIDLFGMDSLVGRHVQDLVNRTAGAWYPQRAHERISVVLAGDGFLEQMQTSWPPSLALHARVLDAILAHEPAAVLVDLLFLDERPGDDAEPLASVLRRHRGRVYLAAPPNGDEAVLPALRAAADTVPVPRRLDERVRGDREYPLVVEDDGVFRPTAALRLYQHVTPAIARGRLDEWAAPMEIAWGVVPPAAPPRAADAPYPTLDEEIERRLDCRRRPLGFGGALLESVVGGEVLIDCPYTQTLMAEDVLLRAPFDERVDDVLRGRVVLYGAGFMAGADVVLPPTHGPLPGVFLHAMALDNLLTWGDDYVRREHVDLSAPEGRRLIGLLGEVATIGFFAILLAVYSEGRGRWTPRVARSTWLDGVPFGFRLAGRVVRDGLLTVCVLGVAVVLFLSFDLAPLHAGTWASLWGLFVLALDSNDFEPCDEPVVAPSDAAEKTPSQKELPMTATTTTTALLVTIVLHATVAGAEPPAGDTPVHTVKKVLIASVACRDDAGAVATVDAAALTSRPVYERKGNGFVQVGLQDGRRCWVDGAMVQLDGKPSVPSASATPQRNATGCAGTRALGRECLP